MTIARRFATQYFAADKDDRDDPEPGQNTGDPASVTSQGAYGAGGNPGTSQFADMAPPPVHQVQVSAPNYGGGGGASFAPYSGGGTAAPSASPAASSGSSATPGGGPPSQSLTEALTRAGIPAEMHPLIQGFSQTEGNNPSGAPTLGFTDSQAGSSLDQHAQALAKQLHDRQSVAGPFPHGGSPQDQASWMATVVGQNGVKSDWQGAAQPARSDYVNRVVKGMPAPTAPSPTLPKTGMHSGVPKSGPWLLEAGSHRDT